MNAAHRRNASTPSSSLATTPLTAAPTAKRACDACHRRKVKCLGDGVKACRNCVVAELKCTYNAVPQKKGPRGHRARVISELRETQRQTQQQLTLDSSPDSPDSAPRGNKLLSNEMIFTCADFFFANIYPTAPILLRQKVGESIGQMNIDDEAYCLGYSLCAYMLIQPNMLLPPRACEHLEFVPQSNAHLGQILLEETLRARKKIDLFESATVQSVVTSYFLFASYFCLNKHNTAWYHLREATTIALSLGMHDESTYSSIPDVAERCRRRRLYWLLFVTERAYALQQHKPLSLHHTIVLPTLEDDPTESVELRGFLHLVNLFEPFDDDFVGLWNKSRTNWSVQELELMQQKLAGALPATLLSTENQAADLRCSQHWLRTIVWQLSCRLSLDQGVPFSAATEGAMSLKFPIDVSRDLVSSTAQLPHDAMEVHGIGLVEKLFDVAYLLTDVMTCLRSSPTTANVVTPTPPEVTPGLSSPAVSTVSRSNRPSSFPTISTSRNLQFGPADFLDQLMKLIASLRGGQQRYMPLLLSKINEMPGGASLGHSFSIMPTPPAIMPDNNLSAIPAASDPAASLDEIDFAMTAPMATLPEVPNEYLAYDYPTYSEYPYCGSSSGSSGSSHNPNEVVSPTSTAGYLHQDKDEGSQSSFAAGSFSLDTTGEDFAAEDPMGWGFADFNAHNMNHSNSNSSNINSMDHPTYGTPVDNYFTT